MITFKVIISLIIILLIIVGIRIGYARIYLTNKIINKNKKILIKETLVLDYKRRLVLITCNDISYLILIGNNSEHIIRVK